MLATAKEKIRESNDEKEAMAAELFELELSGEREREKASALTGKMGEELKKAR